MFISPVVPSDRVETFPNTVLSFNRGSPCKITLSDNHHLGLLESSLSTPLLLLGASLPPGPHTPEGRSGHRDKGTPGWSPGLNDHHLKGKNVLIESVCRYFEKIRDSDVLFYRHFYSCSSVNEEPYT